MSITPSCNRQQSTLLMPDHDAIGAVPTMLRADHSRIDAIACVHPLPDAG